MSDDKKSMFVNDLPIPARVARMIGFLNELGQGWDSEVSFLLQTQQQQIDALRNALSRIVSGDNSEQAYQQAVEALVKSRGEA